MGRSLRYALGLIPLGLLLSCQSLGFRTETKVRRWNCCPKMVEGCAEEPGTSVLDLTPDIPAGPAMAMLPTPPGPASARQDIAAIIDRVPPWTSAHTEEATIAWRAVAQELWALPIADLRAGVETFMDTTIRSEDQTAQWFKVYLILRAIFAVPEIVPRDQVRVFHGFRHHPSFASGDDGPFRLLWPLGFDAQGRLTVEGHHLRYLGKPYDALAEFDYFASRFGKR